MVYAKLSWIKLWKLIMDVTLHRKDKTKSPGELNVFLNIDGEVVPATRVSVYQNTYVDEGKECLLIEYNEEDYL